jgi:hypothetical protein
LPENRRFEAKTAIAVGSPPEDGPTAMLRALLDRTAHMDKIGRIFRPGHPPQVTSLAEAREKIATKEPSLCRADEVLA